MRIGIEETRSLRPERNFGMSSSLADGLKLNVMEDKASDSKATCVLTVLFCGTNGDLSRGQTQIELFSNKFVDATLINDVEEIPRNTTHFMMKFDGCGVAYGLRGVRLVFIFGRHVAHFLPGTLFANGLDEQIELVLTRLRSLLSRFSSVVHRLFGCSRVLIAVDFL